jgi:isoleucyl-tRNA synthetase
VLATDYAAGEASWAGAAPFREEAIGLTFWLRKA